tara:strand:- start:1188 stop:2318 length:1131 start_codon:yes stop_codon:yes gene_type:complete
MEIEQADINSIKPYPNNPRKLSDEAIEKVANSIKEFGFRQPIVVDKDRVIVVGHTRFRASKKLGYKKVPITIAYNLTPSQINAYRIADNRTNEEADWDNDLLNLEIKELQTQDYALEVLGFDDRELDKILFEEKTGLTDDDQIPDDPKNIRTKEGDIIHLGEHRLLCGDSTNEDNYIKLLNGKKPNMVFTDPPYGLNYEYNSHEDKAGDEYLEFCNKWFDLIFKYSECIFLTAGWKYNKFWLMKDPLDIFYWISRNKQSGGKLSHFRKIEPIFLWGKTKNKYNLDYFDYNSDRIDKLREHHTCPKPVKFVMEAISVLDKNSIVLDVFLGSGTSIIACEKTDKICYGIEKDPKYCDVIIQRWEEFTGKKAEYQNGQN